MSDVRISACAITITTNMNERTTQLRALMAAHKMNCTAVGEILGRKVQTVRIWRCNYEARTIPTDALRLLELTLAARVDE